MIMHQANLVTIITPTYNHEKFIGECIESVLGQTSKNWEMIIVDDGSTDGTRDVVAKYQDERIRYIWQENRGIERLAETYNKALSFAKGEFIAILEGDDYWPANKLDIQVHDFKDKSVILSYGYTQVVSQDGKIPLGKIPNRELPIEANMNYPVGRSSFYMMKPDILTYIYPVSVVIRKDALERIGGFQVVSSLPLVDYPTFLRLTLEGKFCFHDTVLGFWRRHRQSTTKNRFPQILKGVKKHIENFLMEYRQKLPISEKEIEKNHSEWEALKVWQIFMLGRWFLVDKEWENARKAFKKIPSAAPYPVAFFITSKFGIIASYLHLNIEFFSRLQKWPTIYEILNGDKYDMVVSKDMLEEL